MGVWRVWLPAGGTTIIAEVGKTVAPYGVSIDWRHMSVLADLMTAKVCNMHACFKSDSGIESLKFAKTLMAGGDQRLHSLRHRKHE